MVPISRIVTGRYIVVVVVVVCDVAGKQRMCRMMSKSTEEEDSATTMDVYTGCASLGVSIVGGVDTPLVTTCSCRLS